MTRASGLDESGGVGPPSALGHRGAEGASLSGRPGRCHGPAAPYSHFDAYEGDTFQYPCAEVGNRAVHKRSNPATRAEERPPLGRV